MATAADVPSKYDVVINGQGYTFLRTLDGSYLSASRHRAEYTSTPTFVERQNVSGAYGDDQQAFFMTIGQRDWSLGEDLQHFRANDDTGSRRFYGGSNVDISRDGEVSMALAAATATAASTVKGAGAYPPTRQSFTSTVSNLIEVDSSGVQTDRGAHGAGSYCTTYACDGVNLFISGSGCTSVRRYNLAANTFNAFSATAMDSICYLNNSLFGSRGGTFYAISTAGVATSQFVFKDVVGSTLTGVLKIAPFGGKIVVLKATGAPAGAELWVWDGTAMSKLADFPPNFVPNDFCVNLGVIYVTGSESFGTNKSRVAVYIYNNGTLALAYRSINPTVVSVATLAICPFGQGVAFVDQSVPPSSTCGIRLWDAGTGGAATVSERLFASEAHMAAADTYLLATGLSPDTTTVVWPGSTSAATTTKVYTSRFDFDNTHPKLIRGVIVNFEAGEDGNGGSVDVGYYTGGLPTVTSLATGITSGQELLFASGTKLSDVGILVTLNKGTSTLGPVLNRVYVRAAPILQSFKVRTYNLDLSSTPQHVTRLEDDTLQPKTGFEQAQALQTAISSATPITVTDKFGTFTAVCEPAQCSIFELHSDGGSRQTPGQYSATIVVREV